MLEQQRHALLMYTSCGWFFNDLAGIETVQVLQYAGRALELARSRLGLDLEAGFLDRLARARSNRPEQGDGRAIFERSVGSALGGSTGGGQRTGQGDGEVAAGAGGVAGPAGASPHSEKRPEASPSPAAPE